MREPSSDLEVAPREGRRDSGDCERPRTEDLVRDGHQQRGVHAAGIAHDHSFEAGQGSSQTVFLGEQRGLHADIFSGDGYLVRPMPAVGSALVASGSAYHRLEEFVRDPLLTVACVLLIVVSIEWLVVTRRIARRLRERRGPRTR
jgi:hypothetical protein